MTREIPFARPLIDEADKKEVLSVLDSHILTHGPKCKEFEEKFSKFLGGGYCVSVSSCMAALHLSYLYFGFRNGDEVIVPAQTHTATAHAVELVGAKPVFVDCDLKTGNLTAEKIEVAITEKTKAISVVHFLGIPCEMPEIIKVAEKYKLKIIEDCALAVGSNYNGKHAGLFGDTGCFSFYPVKHITTGEGGMFVTKHKEIADIVAKLRGFGVDRSYNERKIPGFYDVTMLGLNYRMSELQAALGIQQLNKVDKILEKRKNNFNQLKSNLESLENVYVIDTSDEKATSAYYGLSVILKEDIYNHRDEIIQKLNAEGIGTSIYYPQPVPRMTYYAEKYGYAKNNFKNAEKISDASIALPIGPHLTKEDLEYISIKFRNILEEV